MINRRAYWLRLFQWLKEKIGCRRKKSCSLLLTSEVIATLRLSRCRSWVGTRRVPLLHVSSSPPFSTGRAAFTAHGSTPLVDLPSTSSEASVSIAMASTEVHPCFIPFRQHARALCSCTAGAFAGYFVRHLPLSSILPEARGLRHGEYAPCGRRDRPPPPMPHPTLRAGLGVSLGSPLPPSHAP